MIINYADALINVIPLPFPQKYREIRVRCQWPMYYRGKTTLYPYPLTDRHSCMQSSACMHGYIHIYPTKHPGARLCIATPFTRKVKMTKTFDIIQGRYMQEDIIIPFTKMIFLQHN